MEQEPMSVEELVRRRDELDGQVVSVRATIAVEPQRAYLVADPAVDGVGEVGVLPDDLGDRMLTQVPCRVGGPYYYYDEAVVRGRIGRSVEGGVQLGELSSLRVERGDDRYDVDLDG